MFQLDEQEEFAGITSCCLSLSLLLVHSRAVCAYGTRRGEIWQPRKRDAESQHCWHSCICKSGIIGDKRSISDRQLQSSVKPEETYRPAGYC
ncbi:hypothetical protein B0H66DRAFT_322779 [Apodospora peruviana]|uniref:Secreted protein n=1 Tax=Apodospora peruviana TaxID=516989 RepID=A0AAE0M0V1_9PEZI|nr:hypothetical protein B0H66DRAFT_322779 [Apodospora peruviana]